MNNYAIDTVKDFDLGQTLECGQCFHFEKLEENEYAIVYKKKLLRIRQKFSKLECENTDQKEFENIWAKYFDLDRNYSLIKESLKKADERLTDAIDENWGVRILNQDFDETLMSFIISQNKQIPHIKKIVKDISEKYGEFLGNINGQDFYSFPDREAMKNITEEDYRQCKTGFRAPYLLDAARRLSSGTLVEKNLKEIGYDEAKKNLIEIKGVGEKVANCVLLFSLGYRNAFPVDVWIKRIMENMYFEGPTDNGKIMDFAKEKFGEYGGYAQQYLFYFAKKNEKIFQKQEK